MAFNSNRGCTKTILKRHFKQFLSGPWEAVAAEALARAGAAGEAGGASRTAGTHVENTWNKALLDKLLSIFASNSNLRRYSEVFDFTGDRDDDAGGEWNMLGVNVIDTHFEPSCLQLHGTL